MTDILYQAQHYIISVVSNESLLKVVLLLFPFILLIELPFYLLLLCSIIKKWIRIHFTQWPNQPYTPLVSVVITAYAEKEKIYLTLNSLCEQLYQGSIEVLVVIDDAPNQPETVACVKQYLKTYRRKLSRVNIIPIEKKTRGGLANSRNVGLAKAKGEIMMVIDADTSIENRCIQTAVKHFYNDNVIALSGGLRVRNVNDSFISHVQAIEYKLGIELSRYGLSEMKVLNNISGAYGFFRISILKKIGGWLNGTAEDLDLMLRLHSYAKRYPELKIAYEAKAIAYTSVPDTLRDFFYQRLRWDGDLYYIYIRRHWRSFSTH